MAKKSEAAAPPDNNGDGEAGGSTGLVPVVTHAGAIDEMPIEAARKARDAGEIVRFATETDLKIAGKL